MVGHSDRCHDDPPIRCCLRARQHCAPGLAETEEGRYLLQISGGQIPDRFVELLNRPRYNYWGVRDGRDWSWPPIAHSGKQVMLINGWSGSGGDAFPFYFREAGLGPLIGTRTWGGLIGLSGSPQLIDGGIVTAPTFGAYSVDGEWIIEGYGVEPDVEVVDDPSKMISITFGPTCEIGDHCTTTGACGTARTGSGPPSPTPAPR